MSALDLTSAPNGGLNPWTVASAIHHDGVTYIGYVDGSGNIESIAVSTTGVVSGPHTIHASFEANAHSSPVLLRRASDGRFVTIYSRHNSTPINVRVSTNPDDVSAWGDATNIDGQLGATRYTDYQLYEYDGTLYLFYRDEPTGGTDSRWEISTCSAADPTTGWASQANIFHVVGDRSYVITAMDAENGLLHFIATNGDSTGFTRLGYFYLDLDAGTYHKIDGTDITALLPLTYSEVTEAYVGTTGVFAINVAIDASGYPVIAVWDTIGGDLRYVYLRWSGTAWSATDVASGEVGYEYNGTGTGFGQYGSCIDADNPDIMWVIEDVAGQPEVVRYRTNDGGATFARLQVTSGSSVLLVGLICVRGPNDLLRALYQKGTWDDYTEWSMGISGVGVVRAPVSALAGVQSAWPSMRPGS